jgi:hemerythrin-like metal-binding protein
MAYLEWHPALEVGHAKIDADHRTLVDAINRLHAATEQGEDQAELAVVLNFLRDYTVTHFKVEEALMIQYAYPRASSHFAAHSDLLMQVSDFIAAFRAGKAGTAQEMLIFLETWLVGHILDSDRLLAAHLEGRQLPG